MTRIDTQDTVLPLLADPDRYTACQWDLTDDAHASQRAYWIGLFRWHFGLLVDEAVREAADRGVSEATVRRQAEPAQQEFFAYLDLITAEPARFGRLDILTICTERERVLRAHGFADPYRLAKSRENETALALMPALLRELDAMPDAQRDVEVLRGVFAGNIFDMGATKTVERFQNGTVSFHDTRDELKKRPWLIDDLDDWLARLREPAHRAALLFVDNAGPDIVLGMLPLARYLLQRGTRVILTANTTPTLNDVTHDELTELLSVITRFDDTLAAALRDGRLRLVASGNGVPLIDLTKLSPKLVRTVRDEAVDLVVIEGMGRAIESNLHVPFTCDVIKIGMVKDPGVARELNGELYDLVLRFERGRSL